MRLFVPVEVVKKVGPFEVNGEIGYAIVQNGSDECEYGLAIGRQVTERIELIGELHGPDRRTGSDAPFERWRDKAIPARTSGT